jgi:hypothetical protein
MLQGLAVVRRQEAQHAVAALGDARAEVCSCGPVALIALRGITHAESPPLRVAAWIEHLHRVTEALIPLRLGEQWPGAAEAAEAVSRQERAWSMALEACAGCTEVTLRYRAAVSAGPQAEPPWTDGRSYLEARARALAAARGVDQRAFDLKLRELGSVVRCATDAVVERGGGQMPLPGVTLLLQRGRIDEARQRFNASPSASAWAWTGPWPLFTFGAIAHARAIRACARDDASNPAWTSARSA